ncbi:unnamed protein product [Rotaria sp. Silwood1]|nr:unnamed protein product [Rotaria sp. Silwood1]
MEKRDDDDTDDDEEMDGSAEELDSTTYDDATVWSLQNAIEVIFKKFLDKSLTVNWWQCGLDLKLNTWKNQLFSRHNYNEQKEKQERLKMVQYATNDCTSEAELYFHMYPGKSNDQQTPQTPPATTQTITLPAPTITSTNITKNFLYELSDIMEDELITSLKPRFNKNEYAPRQSNYSQDELIITTTAQELDELNSNEQQQQQQSTTTQTTTTTLSKSERQRQKNMKLKWKQQNRPDFQNKLKRPIYYKYDFRKIRAQLCDDNIHTSHQITTNRKYNEVIIGFKSRQELEHATKVIKINYFSKSQYADRWDYINSLRKEIRVLLQERLDYQAQTHINDHQVEIDLLRKALEENFFFEQLQIKYELIKRNNINLIRKISNLETDTKSRICIINELKENVADLNVDLQNHILMKQRLEMSINNLENNYQLLDTERIKLTNDFKENQHNSTLTIILNDQLKQS